MLHPILIRPFCSPTASTFATYTLFSIALTIGNALFFLSLLTSKFSFSFCPKKIFKNPFSYDIGLKVISSKTKSAQMTICCHGYGHNNKIVDNKKGNLAN